VVEDYRATGLTLRRHPLALLRPALLDALGGGLADTRRLAAAPAGSWLRLPGLVLIRQRPGTAKGIVFVTVEDEWGIANLVVYPDVAARYRAALVGARLLAAEGRVEREAAPHAEAPIVHLIVRRLADRSDLLDGLPGGGEPPAEAGYGEGDRGAWGERALGRADEVRRPEPEPCRPLGAKLPPSRDFR
jgi:error-prone DNA polymerase